MSLKPTTPTPLYSCFLCLGDPEAQELGEKLFCLWGPQGARRFEAWTIVEPEPEGAVAA